ncbi:MAG: hypothetical protein KDK24_04050 [Pseudooceanicola sp.]|nr:hypothetical protein [Pseudooceanicola sp.]
MASKLFNQTQTLGREVDTLKTHLKAQLEYRIQLSSLVDMIIPRLRAQIETEWDANYAVVDTPKTRKIQSDLEMRVTQAGQYTTYYDNARAYARNAVIMVNRELATLKTMVAAYDPKNKKKKSATGHDLLLDDKQVKAREQKRAYAEATIAKAEAMLAQVDNNL